MVRHTLKILQQMLQDFKNVSDHFTTLRSKGLMKMRVKMKKRSHKSDIIDRPRHVHKYTKYKMCPSVMFVMCNEQRLSNSRIHEKVK